jgi:hypothetical protein
MDGDRKILLQHDYLSPLIPGFHPRAGRGVPLMPLS